MTTRPGTATTTADTLVGIIPATSGSGTLADFTFQAIAPGTSALTLSGVILQNSTSADIPFTTSDGTVTIGNAVVPKPGGLSFIGGLAPAASLQLRKTA